jgi:Pyruvate/2-oxoacid:ferredoxin oxidoreductase gamma subunit
LEREVLFSGIGGQGVQLCARAIASAAMLDGRHVQLFGSYGGMMRGGNTDATLVVGDEPVESPPTVTGAWCGVLMHHEYASTAVRRVVPGGLVFVNSTVWETGPDLDGHVVVELPATEIAIDLGNQLAAGMVMLGGIVTATRLVGLESLHQAASASVPAYRSQHIELNRRAIEAGASAVEAVVSEAWDGSSASSAP